MTLALSKFCSDHGFLFPFVPNITHIQQSCDFSLFRPLKSIWKEEVRKWKDENEEFSSSKKDCVPILQKVLNRIEFSAIQNGYKTCGLYPSLKKTIDHKKLLKELPKAYHLFLKTLLRLFSVLKHTCNLFKKGLTLENCNFTNLAKQVMKSCYQKSKKEDICSIVRSIQSESEEEDDPKWLSDTRDPEFLR